MLTKIAIEEGWFFFLIAFAIIGLLFVALIIVYIIFGVLDLTYYERHKKDQERYKDCPDKIEDE